MTFVPQKAVNLGQAVGVDRPAHIHQPTPLQHPREDEPLVALEPENTQFLRDLSFSFDRMAARSVASSTRAIPPVGTSRRLTVSAPIARLRLAGEPSTTIFPWSMMARRWHRRSASSM